jgi:DHA2 family methylenomycin A resistance protein-like MFS transporter
LIPGRLTIIRATFEEPRRRALAIGLWSISSGLSMAIGPALGGLIVGDLGWRWVFVVNVPLAVILVALAARFVPRLSPSPARSRFDWLGAILTTTAIAALAYGIIYGQVAGLTSPAALGLFAAGIAALMAFVAWERHRPEPLVDVSLFLRPAFAAANVAALIGFFAFVGAIVYFSQYFQPVMRGQRRQSISSTTYDNGPKMPAEPTCRALAENLMSTTVFFWLSRLADRQRLQPAADRETRDDVTFVSQ